MYPIRSPLRVTIRWLTRHASSSFHSAEVRVTV